MGSSLKIRSVARTLLEPCAHWFPPVGQWRGNQYQKITHQTLHGFRRVKQIGKKISRTKQKYSPRWRLWRGCSPKGPTELHDVAKCLGLAYHTVLRKEPIMHKKNCRKKIPNAHDAAEFFLASPVIRRRRERGAVGFPDLRHRPSGGYFCASR